MLTIIHGADFHLDSPFEGLAPERAAARRGEQRQLLNRLADLAADRRADLVLLAGDLLDGERVYYETGEALTHLLGSMGVPVFIAPGNHDFYSARSLYAGTTWPTNVHIFKEAAMTAVPLPRLGCVVYGAAFTAPDREDDPLERFTASGDGGLQIGVLHGDVGGRGRYGPIDPANIAGSGLDYLALGHVHRSDGLQWAGETPWCYPGCPEGRGFDETGEKGVYVVTLDGGKVEAEFVPLCSRRYEVLTVDVTGGDPGEALLAALPEGAERDIYRIILTGECDREDLDLVRLARLAEDKFYSVTLRDHTRVRRDVWQRAGEDTLTGHFLRLMRDKLEGADEEQRHVLERAVRFGLAALEGGEVPGA